MQSHIKKAIVGLTALSTTVALVGCSTTSNTSSATTNAPNKNGNGPTADQSVGQQQLRTVDTTTRAS